MNVLPLYTREQCTKIYNAIESPSWRCWKIIDEDDTIKNKYSISNAESLYEFIHKCRNPKAIYVSVSCFLNPTRVHGFFANQKRYSPIGEYYYPREGYLWADSIILSSYFFIDIDSEGDLRVAQEDGRKIIKRLKNTIKLHSIQFSGSKGIHLLYHQNQRQIKHPHKRIRAIKLQKAKIVKELLKLKLSSLNHIHAEISKNPFCVYASPYSFKYNGNMVQPISEERFMNEDIYSILAIEPKGDDKTGSNRRDDISPTHYYRGRKRDGLSACPIYYSIANFVPGLRNNYVPFLKIHKKRFNKVNLKKLGEEISDMLIFDEENYIWIISLKLYEKRKLLKIMRRVKASNYSEFNRRYAKFRFSNMKYRDNEVSPPPKPIQFIQSEKKYRYSRAHYNFFVEFDYHNSLLCGNSELKTYRVKHVL